MNRTKMGLYFFLSEKKDRTQGCVAMTTGTFAGLWDVISCSNKEKYICKKKAEGVLATTVQPTTPPLTCASGWTPVAKRNVCYKVRKKLWIFCFFNNMMVLVKKEKYIFFFIWKVYKKMKEHKKTWQEAQDFCKAIGGNLISILSIRDLDNMKYVNLHWHPCWSFLYLAVQKFLCKYVFCFLVVFTVLMQSG